VVLFEKSLAGIEIKHLRKRATCWVRQRPRID
jgi:hypothetical protein